ncbi:hypothetical protein AVEN_53665-1 [Araneus ventricosus]|uniref:Uncharacterized protein n=1 Tax=Araneus ventricosus TaxID=182803 RepID=A0A4Y2G1G7_ARAVE|nr:hypothetical protein AVEN_53665-1 [Araneus ventricosus]
MHVTPHWKDFIILFQPPFSNSYEIRGENGGGSEIFFCLYLRSEGIYLPSPSGLPTGIFFHTLELKFRIKSIGYQKPIESNFSIDLNLIAIFRIQVLPEATGFLLINFLHSKRPRWPNGKVSALEPEGSKHDSTEDPLCIGTVAR